MERKSPAENRQALDLTQTAPTPRLGAPAGGERTIIQPTGEATEAQTGGSPIDFDRTLRQDDLRELIGDRPIATPAATGSRYRILSLHARGGLGIVYLAEDTELRRRVALKEIQVRHANDARSRQRFNL